MMSYGARSAPRSSKPASSRIWIVAPMSRRPPLVSSSSRRRRVGQSPQRDFRNIAPEDAVRDLREQRSLALASRRQGRARRPHQDAGMPAG